MAELIGLFNDCRDTCNDLCVLDIPEDESVCNLDAENSDENFWQVVFDKELPCIDVAGIPIQESSKKSDRMTRNRESAAQSRKRQKQKVSDMEKQISVLKNIIIEHNLSHLLPEDF